MSSLDAHIPARRRAPTVMFLIVSLVFGLAVAAITPPLRGPDETAHFLRAYGFAQGVILPVLADEQGRRGLLLPGPLHAEVTYFEQARAKAQACALDYASVLSQRHTGEANAQPGGPPRFILFAGSESYSPAGYFPHVVAALAARAVGLEFLPTLYLMRLTGLLATTALLAWAITLTPALKWAFLAIALLPASLQGRATVSADGLALAYTLLGLALSLRALAGARDHPIGRVVLYALATLTKPPQIAFAAMEMATPRPLRLGQLIARIALAVVPAALLLALWLKGTSADMGSWRIVDPNNPPEHFSIGWKLRHMLAHPLEFFTALVRSFDYWPELWRQGIGILNWLDARLRAPLYPMLAILLALVCLGRLRLFEQARARVALASLLAVIGYVLLVHFIFYVMWTPPGADRIYGVQGRYFVVALPLLAVLAATVVPWRLSDRLTAAAACLLALLSGIGSVDALLRCDWRVLP